MSARIQPPRWPSAVPTHNYQRARPDGPAHYMIGQRTLCGVDLEDHVHPTHLRPDELCKACIDVALKVLRHSGYAALPIDNANTDRTEIA